MTRRKQQKATAFQRTYEGILRIAMLLLAAVHMWLSFARHFFAPENNMTASKTLQMMLKTEKWFAVGFLAILIVYLILSFTKFKDTSYRIRLLFRKAVSAEGILLTCLFAYFLLCCYVQSRMYSNIFKTVDITLFDLAVCVFILFPIPIILGPQRAKRYIDVAFHAIMLFSTGYIVWGLWNLFRLNIVSLPNGLQIEMTEQFCLYPGVNQNIGAAIGVTMILICMYMIASHGWIIKLIYAIVMLPHLYATLLTNSRASFVALLIAFTLFAFMLVWDSTKKSGIVKRILFAGMTAAVTAAAIWMLRRGVFRLFDQVTHFSELVPKSQSGGSAVRPINVDTSRLRIWRASVRLMASGGREFLFGTPLALIPSRIKEIVMEIYGFGNRYAHAHNVILQTGLVAGVPGMLLFLAFLIKILFPCIRTGIGKQPHRRQGSYMLPIAVLALLCLNVFEPFLLFYFSVSACLFFLFCGFIIAIDKERKTES